MHVKGGLIEGELNYMEIYLSFISQTIEKSFPNPHLIITEHPDKWLDVHAQLCPALPIFWNFDGSEIELFKKLTIVAEWNIEIPPPILLFRPNELFNLVDAISEMIQLSDIFVDACKDIPMLSLLETLQETDQFYFSNPVFSISPKLPESNESSSRSIRSFEKILSSMDLAHWVERKTMSIYNVGLYEKIYKINAELIENWNKGDDEIGIENDPESVDLTGSADETGSAGETGSVGETGSDRILETSLLSEPNDYLLSRKTSTPEVTVPCLETRSELMMKAERFNSQKGVNQTEHVHIKQSKSQENKSPPKKKIKKNYRSLKRITVPLNTENPKMGRRASSEIPEPALKTSHFTIGNSPKTSSFPNEQLKQRPKRSSQLLASAIIKMELDEENINQNRKSSKVKKSRFPENGQVIQKCIFVKQTYSQTNLNSKILEVIKSSFLSTDQVQALKEYSLHPYISKFRDKNMDYKDLPCQKTLSKKVKLVKDLIDSAKENERYIISTELQAGLCLVERFVQRREIDYQRIIELEDKTDDELEEIVADIQFTLPSIIILSYTSFSKLQFETFGCNCVVTFNTPKIDDLGTNHLHIITHQSIDHYIYDESDFSNDQYPTEDIQKFYNLYNDSKDLDPPDRKSVV